MKVLLLFSHLLFAAFGFALGIYLLPILTAPETPGAAAMTEAVSQAQFQGEFMRDLEGSDFFHWGEGTVSVGDRVISHEGRLAPGPDYRLYLSPVFVETEAAFDQHRADMVQVGPVNTFDGFIVAVPAGIDPLAYGTVIIWCESFGEFITAARYR